MKKYPHATHLSPSKNPINSKPAFFEQVGGKNTDINSLISETSFESEFGFFEWNIQENEIKLCSYLSSILAFKNNNTSQTLDAWNELTHPADITLINLKFDRIQLKETPYVISESRKLCRDGQWRWFAVRGKFIEFDDERRPIRSVGTCTDITKLKEARLTLQEMQILFSEIELIKKYSQSDISINKLCAEILKCFERLTNTTKSLLIFSSIRNKKDVKIEFINSNDPALYNLNKDEADNLISNREKREFVNKILNDRAHLVQNNGMISLLGIHLDLPFQQQGIIIIERSTPFDETILDFLEPLVGTVTNIISIKKLQENSCELDNMISFFIQQVPTPVAVFDINMCYKFASDAWRKAFRFSETSYNIIGRSHYEINQNQPKEWRDHHQRALNGEIIKFEATKITGYLPTPYWAEGSVRPWYTVSGNVGGIIIHSTIVTERKQNEKNLDITIKNLTHSNNSLEQFAHICSHDLKEPLRSVSNFIQLLVNSNSEHFNEESLLYVRHILSGLGRMDNLIKDILLYSKVARKTVNKQMYLDLNDVVRESIETLDCRINEVEACFKVAKLPIILGAPAQIKQLFLNLLGNALKFHSDKAVKIELFSEDKDLFWEIHVRDNGIGIDEAYHKEIFTIFKRLHSKNQYEGSGIGLSTCQKIIHEHLGDIYVKSVPNGGSEFIFTLPKGKMK